MDVGGKQVDFYNTVNMLIAAGQWKTQAEMAKSQAADFRAIVDPSDKIRVQSKGEFAFRQMLPVIRESEGWRTIRKLRNYGQWTRIATALNTSFEGTMSRCA